MRVTEALIRIAPGIGADRSLLLRPSLHEVASHGPGWQIALAKLEALLTGMSLTPCLPEALHRMVRTRQIAYLGGRLCAEHALDALGVINAEVGRSMTGAPCWPVGTTGSIAHTSTSAYAVATRSGGGLSVGIDSEFVIPEMCGAIASVCCTARERLLWLHEPSESLLATLIFSAKESFYKAVDATLRRLVDFREIELVAHDRLHQRLQFDASGSNAIQRLARAAYIRYWLEESTVHTAVICAMA